jgi:hypothetical protein
MCDQGACRKGWVAEVYYRGIGALGLLRQSSLKTIRIDKGAADLAAEAAARA